MSSMNCNAFERILRAAVEAREALPSELLRGHADLCDECANLLAHDAVLVRTLPSLQEQVPDIDLADSVVARWKREQSVATLSARNVGADIDHRSLSHARIANPSRTRSDKVRTYGRVVAVVAVVFLMATTGLLFFPGERPDENRPGGRDVGQTQSSVVTRDASNPPTVYGAANERQQIEEIDGLVRDVGAAYFVLANDVGDTFNDAASMIPSVEFYSSEVKGTEGPVRRTRPALSGEWARGLKPIGRKVEKAFGFLLDAIPKIRATST